MKRFASILRVIVLLLNIPSLTLADSVKTSVAGEDLGHIEFSSSGSPQAQEHFLRGVLFLHSFEYEDAKEAFQQAQSLDPDFAMAYWGEAMTENHPLWLEQNIEAARAVLERLAPSPKARIAKAPTKREQGYMRAIEALYGQGDKVTRDKAYAKAMLDLSETFPEDLEAAAFSALAILGTAQGVRDFRTYMKAAGIAEIVYQQNRRHPGAVHYLIHAYDDPIHAPLGLRPANVYAEIAPAAAHAQHMPSHIFMALGMWDRVIEANEQSWSASETRRKEKGLSVQERPYHTLYWLMYAYLQQGQSDKAKALLKLVESDARNSPSLYTRGNLTSLRATNIIETHDWKTDAWKEDRTDLQLPAAANELFAIGMSAIHLHDLELARKAITKLHARIGHQDPTSFAHDKLGALIMMKELAGLIREEEGNTQEAFALLEEASNLEDGRPYDYGPPYPIKPPHELYGEMLLKHGKYRQADAQFEKALARYPNRGLSVQGMAKAMALEGQAKLEKHNDQ